MDLISVIIPVYNVERFLNQCIESIVNQTYKNLEIILVNDGSTDNSAQICNEWQKKDKRIKVIHKKNGGLSDARNVGLSNATGKYVGFVDGDDWIHKEMYQMLYGDMSSNGSDISACGVELVWQDDDHSQLLTRKGNCVLNNEEAMQAIIEESWLKQPVWYKLYKAELIKDIKFPIGKYHEDVFWSYQVIARATKVSIIDKIGYYYIQHNNSIMGQQYSAKRLDVIEGKQQRLGFISRYYPRLLEVAKIDLVFTCLFQGQNVLSNLSRNEYQDIFRYLNDVLKNNDLLNYKYTNLSKKQKIWLASMKISLFYTCKIRNCLKIGC